MNNQQILDGAPKDGSATHFDINDKEYISLNPEYIDQAGQSFVKSWSSSKKTWEKLDYNLSVFEDIRSLADIKRIVELESGLNFCKEFLELMHQMPTEWTIKESVVLRNIVIERIKGGDV